jgi:hypothetical protein
VNGSRLVGQARVAPGDVIAVGDTELRVEIADG